MKPKSIFLLFVFLFLKVGVAHSLTHSFSHDDVDDCEYCVLIVDSNKTQTFDESSFSNNNSFVNIKDTTKPILLLYKNPLIVKEYHRFYFFNKPPPSL